MYKCNLIGSASRKEVCFVAHVQRQFRRHSFVEDTTRDEGSLNKIHQHAMAGIPCILLDRRGQEKKSVK